jgi:hypothetical protein
MANPSVFRNVDKLKTKKRGFFEKEAWINLLWPIGLVLIALLAGIMIPLLVKFK